jgi:hypothetical protein
VEDPAAAFRQARDRVLHGVVAYTGV